MSDMAAISPEHLNKLFVLLHRSLLQYVGECWPWTAEDAHATHTLAAIRDVNTAQKQDEALLAEPLHDIGWIIDFGGYPTLYTDLHYVSLNYLLKQIVISQQKIVSELDAATQAYSGTELLKQVADTERNILKTVQSLVAGLAVTAKAS